MKSIKPGRGPSAMGAVGSVFGVIFGIIWTIAAASMGAPWFFPLFGIVFIGIGIAQTIYHYKNATGKNRFSAFDITEDGEEPDPLEKRFTARESQEDHRSGESRFCPYCGEAVEGDYQFCPRCGKELP